MAKEEDTDDRRSSLILVWPKRQTPIVVCPNFNIDLGVAERSALISVWPKVITDLVCDREVITDLGVAKEADTDPLWVGRGHSWHQSLRDWASAPILSRKATLQGGPIGAVRK